MRIPRVVLGSVALSFVVTSIAHSQATRTWISGVGDDANPCSRTAPCKTWAGAIGKTATGGEIDALDPGGFGALTITKAITLDGGGGQVASVLVAGTNGIVVAAGASDSVILRNLRFDGLGPGAGGGLNGISFLSGGALHIDHCFIFNFTLDGISLAVNTGADVMIDDTVSEGNLNNGIEVQSTNSPLRVSISNSHFSNNKNGILAGSEAQVAIRNSDANNNTQSGFVANGGSRAAILNIVDSLAANNITSGVTAGGGTGTSTVRLSNVTLYGNTTGLATGTNGKIESYGNNVNSNGGVTPTKLTLE